MCGDDDQSAILGRVRVSAIERAAVLADSDAFVHAPAAYSILDIEGRQLAANPTFHELFRTSDGLIQVEDITHPEEIERTAAYLHALVSGEQSRVVVDKRYLRADGSVFWGRLTAKALVDSDGQPEILLGIIEDVTPQMETLSQLTTVSDIKSKFVARVSHDLRTPLHAISGLAELLSHADLGPQNRSFADAIEHEADALRMLVDDLLDLSRGEAGRIEVSRTSFSLGACVRGVVDLLRHRADERGLELIVTIDEHIEDSVWGDPDRVRQVLVNLVDNAIKFTSQGSVEVIVDSGRDTDITIAVRDSGAGIDPDDLARVFEPFAQNHADQSGTGLGLTISRDVADVMGGSLEVDSTPGVGSTFTLTVTLPPATEAVSEVPNSPTRATVEAGPVVLVVEDSPVNRLLVASQLDQLGYRHQLASDGAQALEMLRSHDFALVLMDWHLPDMDGLEVTRLLRAWETQEPRQRVPVVAVTARAMSGDRQMCLDAGMDDFLAKPAGLDDLHRVLRQWITGDEAPSPASVTPAATPDGFADIDAIELLADELGDPSIVATLISTFLDELPARRSAIVDGAKLNDLDKVHRAAHTLKSTSAVLGALRLSRVATELERRARCGDPDLEELLQEFNVLADEAMTGFPEIVERLGES